MTASATRERLRTSQATSARSASPPATAATTPIADIGHGAFHNRARCFPAPSAVDRGRFPALSGNVAPAPSDGGGMIDAMAEPPALDAPVAGLSDADALAKAWLLELLAARPLIEADRVPLGRLAVEGPALCAAVVRALVSDRELSRLREDGDLAGVAASAGPAPGGTTPSLRAGAPEALPGRPRAAPKSAIPLTARPPVRRLRRPPTLVA